MAFHKSARRPTWVITTAKTPLAELPLQKGQAPDLLQPFILHGSRKPNTNQRATTLKNECRIIGSHILATYLASLEELAVYFHAYNRNKYA